MILTRRKQKRLTKIRVQILNHKNGMNFFYLYGSINMSTVC